MPSFTTTAPISAVVELAVGSVSLTAGDGDETVVEVRPSDPAREPDVRAAQQTVVDYADGRLSVRGPRQRGIGIVHKAGSIDLTIALPAGSTLHGNAAVAGFRCTGRLDECRIKVAVGDVQLDETGPLNVATSAGTVVVDRVAGRADITTSGGRVRVREISGSAVVKSSNGEIRLGEVGGDLRVNAANGGITVDTARADVTAYTANGDVRVGEIARGTASLKTAYGEVEFGIRGGTAARLDVVTRLGNVRNELDAADRPQPSEETAEVQARTSIGDIVIRRAPQPAGR